MESCSGCGTQHAVVPDDIFAMAWECPDCGLKQWTEGVDQAAAAIAIAQAEDALNGHVVVSDGDVGTGGDKNEGV